MADCARPHGADERRSVGQERAEPTPLSGRFDGSAHNQSIVVGSVATAADLPAGAVCWRARCTRTRLRATRDQGSWSGLQAEPREAHQEGPAHEAPSAEGRMTRRRLADRRALHDELSGQVLARRGTPPGCSYQCDWITPVEHRADDRAAPFAQQRKCADVADRCTAADPRRAAARRSILEEARRRPRGMLMKTEWSPRGSIVCRCGG